MMYPPNKSSCLTTELHRFVKAKGVSMGLRDAVSSSVPKQRNMMILTHSDSNRINPAHFISPPESSKENMVQDYLKVSPYIDPKEELVHTLNRYSNT